MQRPHLELERVVNERLFGLCNHEHWHHFTDKYKRSLLVCDQCGEEFSYEVERTFAVDQRQLTPAPEFMRQQVRRYSEGEVLPSLVLRQVESGGWSVLVKHVGTRFTCELSKNGQVFSAGGSVRISVCEADC